MKLKKFFAVAAACAVAALSTATLALSNVVSAAETEIAYTGPTDGAFSMNDDGSTLRLNIFNDWTQVKALDINNKGSFEEAVNVTFTVSGLTGSCNKNPDNTDGDAYKAELVGAIGQNEYWDANQPSKNNVINDSVALTGNGQYTVSFKVPEAADTILCLILSTNINAYNYAASGKPADTGIEFKIDKITTGAVTGGGDNTDPTQAPTNADGTPSTTEAPTNADGTLTTTADNSSNNNNNNTTNNNTNTGGSTSGGTVLGNSTSTTSASTGDAGVAVAIAGLVVTAGIGAAAVALRSKKK